MKGAPKGNQYAKGNSGGGRPSAYKEQSAAKIVKDIFFEKQDKEKVMNVIKSGHYSGFDVLRMKILTGNDRIFSETLRKLVPDLVEADLMSGGKPMPIMQYVLGNNRNQEDYSDEATPADSSGGDVGVQDGEHPAIPDSSSTIGSGSDANISSGGVSATPKTGSDPGLSEHS